MAPAMQRALNVVLVIAILAIGAFAIFNNYLIDHGGTPCALYGVATEQDLKPCLPPHRSPP